MTRENGQWEYVECCVGFAGSEALHADGNVTEYFDRTYVNVPSAKKLGRT